MAADSSDSDSAQGQEPAEGRKPTDLGKGDAGKAAPGPAEKTVASEQPGATDEARAAGESRADHEPEVTGRSKTPGAGESQAAARPRATNQRETTETPDADESTATEQARPDSKSEIIERSRTTETPDADEKPSATSESETESDESRPYPPALIATAVALPVVLVVAVLVAAVLARRMPVEREPLVLGPVPAPAATGEACTKLLPALPADLGEFTKSTLVEPAPPATRAWQRPDGGDAIVLRCGLDRPLEFHRASPLQIVNDVQWFEARDDAAKASTWFAVDRETYIALTVPDGSGPTPLQEVSDTITANLPPKPLDPGPLPN
ncbi:Protein of unknown function [Nocardia amikacinitolerans]|uniref:DUF3515 domain-containing protein n=1 Tax=Nocardia amikacinitolerans TaxID=756689 RepID=A0A285LUC9_9NOCA|nr:DUF3515 domain-containing protein [Nocardia amikacinitolerans]SNY88495.1 Protein of unknown function [Nocardia amikacinitolerans]